MKKIVTTFVLLAIFGLNSFSQNVPTGSSFQKNKAALHGLKNQYQNTPDFDLPAGYGRATKNTHQRGIESLIWKPDTIITYDAIDTLLNRYTHTCDSNGNLLTELYETWQSSAWVNSFRYTYTYDGNGNRLTVLYENWQSGAWVNSVRGSYTYDSNGNRLTELYESWQSGAWVNYSRYTYTYDGNGNMLTELWENWQSSAWINYNRETYTYDSNGNLLTKLYESWQSGAWVNDDRYTYTYDGNGNLLTDLLEDWQSGAWMNTRRYTYTYDSNGNRLTYLYEGWQTSAWVNSVKGSYTYDGNGNLLTKLWEIWQSGAWVNEFRETYTYDSNGNSVTEKSEFWQSGAWQPDDMTFSYLSLYANNEEYPEINYDILSDIYRYEASFKSFTNGITNVQVENSITIYPNPASIFVQVESDKLNGESIKILDITGRQVKSEKLKVKSSKCRINIGNLPAGLYFVKMETNQGTVVKKFVKQ